MAKHQSAASNLSQQVNSKLADNQANTNTAGRSASPNTATQTPDLTNLLVLNAAVAVYRSQNAPEGKPFTPSAEQQKTFAEAQKIFAEKRGIIPDNEGKFREEHLANELSPTEIIKQSAFNHYKATSDKNKAFADIQQELQSVYENDAQTPEPTPEPLIAVNSSLQNRTFLTDNDFLSLDKNKQIEYLEGLSEYGAEKERLTKLAEDYSNSKEHQPVEIAKENGDVTPPKLKDGDYKSSKGDIIDYMMEQIIMEGLDWIGNRCVDAACYPLYGILWETGRTVKKIKEPVKSYINDKCQNFFNLFRDKKEEKTEKTTSKSTHFSEILDRIDMEKAVLTSKNIPQFTTKDFNLIKDLINHDIYPDDKGYYRKGKFHSYEDPDGKDSFIAIQSAYHCMYGALLNDKINPNSDPKIAEDLMTWVIETDNACEDAAKTGKNAKEVNVPKSLQDKGFDSKTLNNHLKEAKDNVVAYSQARPLIEKMEKDASLFALNYAQYKLAETARTNPDEKTQDFEKLRSEFEAEGKLLMYQNYEHLRKGNDKAISTEEMLQMSQKMADTSKELFNKGDNKKASPNLVEDKLTQQEKNISPKSLDSYADELTFEDVKNIELNDLKILEEEEAFLKTQQAQNNSKREDLQAIKERLGMTERKRRENNADHLKKQIKAKPFEQSKVMNPSLKKASQNRG